jgi:hypothetical protein
MSHMCKMITMPRLETEWNGVGSMGTGPRDGKHNWAFSLFCLKWGSAYRSFRRKRGFYISFFLFLLLQYWGYIVTFIKVLTLYHSWIHPLHYSPLSIPGKVSTGLIFHFHTWVHKISTIFTGRRLSYWDFTYVRAVQRDMNCRSSGYFWFWGCVTAS